MSNKVKAPLVPKLQFPEFRAGKAWFAQSMNEVYSFKGNNTLSRDKLNYKSGTIKNIHYGDIHTKFSTHFDITREDVPYVNESDLPANLKADNFCMVGDLIFADASEDMEDIGKAIEIIRTNGEQVVSGLHTILARQTKSTLVTGFGGHLFKSTRVRAQIRKESQGAKVLGLAASRLAKIKLAFPLSRGEQQKIADCLSSLDELIAAQARKVDALKTHKKGLTLQLFPREGEAQPRLRFPEFRDAGEWKEKKLSDAITPVVREVPKPKSLYLALGLRSHGKGTFLKPDQDPEKNAMDKLFLVHRGDLIVNITFAWEGAVAIAGVEDQGCHVSHRFPTYVFNDRISIADFFKFVITNKSFVHKLGLISPGGAGRNRVMNKKDFLQLAVLLPDCVEQQRIADCLTALDTLITTATKELETLKTHKKGLLQQLFPSPEAVEI